jgi:hypothetical protein
MYESTAKYVCRVKEKVHLVFFFLKKKYCKTACGEGILE